MDDLLHGTLDIEIIEGKGLPNTDGFIGMSFGRNKSDPYCTVDICSKDKSTHRVAKTRVIDDNLNPKWNERFAVDVCHECESLQFKVKDQDVVKNDHMGTMFIRGEDIHRVGDVEGWYPLTGKKMKPAGRIRVRVSYKPFHPGSVTTNDVPGTIFPVRKGCRVKLYQDAHTPPVPPVTDVVTAEGKPYQPTQLWVDLSRSIEEAQNFIYIVGWSVNASIRLVRDGENGAGDSDELGVVLKRKASEGVRVLIMLWDEAASTKGNPNGMMGVHDEETFEYFKYTDVSVVKTSRQKLGARFRERMYAMGTYTHHQKCVIMDAAPEGGASSKRRRRLVAYAGGIDLTDGRYDTPQHSLFHSLTTVHKDDYYNKVCKSTGNVGPRQPWHDIHMYVEGKAAFDLVINFVERWRCQAKSKERHLLRIDEHDFDLEWKAADDSEPTWNVQFFRSIDEDSVQFDFRQLSKLLAVKGKNFDASIQKAYIHHIRRARKFIYIENQYFIGSSHCWLDPNPLSPHLVPIELTARIISAIRSKEDFRVYVVLPLHGEGDPTAAATQEILFYQHNTVQMMYHKIAKVIKEVGIDAHPTDYLGFFCLGKREAPQDVPGSLDPPPSGSIAAKVRDSLRFMIYVHSKMAIFDDEYIIVGTANVNERSMSGNRDSELALGAYQPQYTKENCGGPEGSVRGDISTFRLALWAEHCGAHMQIHEKASSLDCMSTMREIGEGNLTNFLWDTGGLRSNSHLMSYPYSISQEGGVTRREDCLEFPDTGGSVMGRNTFLPDTLVS